VTRHEDLLERMERANPVPDPSRLYPDSDESLRFSQLVYGRRNRMDDVKVRPIKPDAPPPRSNRRILVAAAVVILVGIGVVAALLSGRGGGEVAGDPAPTTTQAPATTTQPGPPAATITEAGLPTEWAITLSTRQTDIEGGVRLDTTIQLGGGEMSAEGSISQVVLEAEMVQGATVECSGTTYTEEFLWSATPPGTGELALGDAGSIAIEFDSVVITSSHMNGLGTGTEGSGRLCAQWTGTYTGTSGELAATSGSFTATFAATSQGQVPTLIFDS